MAEEQAPDTLADRVADRLDRPLTADETALAVALARRQTQDGRQRFGFAFVEALLHEALQTTALGLVRLADIEVVPETGRTALDLDFLRSDQALMLTGCTLHGDLLLANAHLEELDLSGSSLPRLIAKSLHLNSNLLLDGCRIGERLDLEGCRIEGSLSLNRAELVAEAAEERDGERGPVAQGDPRQVRREDYRRGEMAFLFGARIGGSLRLSEARCNRKIRMTNARIEGDLDLWKAAFVADGAEENGLIATNCRIGEKLIITNVAFSETSRLALDYSQARILQAERDEKLWPRAGRLSLEGFVFDSLTFPQRQKGTATTVFDEDLTIDWLKRNGPSFYRQPWRHAATSFREKGYRSEATKILVAMEREQDRVDRLADPGERAQASWLRRAVSRLLRALWWFADYGHRPQKVLWPIVILILLNAAVNYALITTHPAVFVTQSEDVVLAGQKPEEFVALPLFDSLSFAIDTFVPGLEFGQEQSWQPNWRDPIGRIYAIYLYLFHVTAGFILTGVLVAGVTKKLTDEA